MKTTIDVPDKEWSEFSQKVVKDKGNRKLNAVVINLIKRVNNGEIQI